MSVALLSERPGPRGADQNFGAVIPRLASPSRVLSARRTEEEAWYEIGLSKFRVYEWTERDISSLLLVGICIMGAAAGAEFLKLHEIWLVVAIGFIFFAVYLPDFVSTKYFWTEYWEEFTNFDAAVALLLMATVLHPLSAVPIVLLATFAIAARIYRLCGSNLALIRVKESVGPILGCASALLVAAFELKPTIPPHIFPIAAIGTMVYAAIYIWYFFSHLTILNLIRFASPLPFRPFRVVPVDPPVEQLRLGEIHLWEAISYLRSTRIDDEFDSGTDLYWKARDFPRVAARLERAETALCIAAQRGVDAYNISKKWVDAARRKLSRLTNLAQLDLQQNAFDNARIKAGASAAIDIEIVASLKAHLKAKAITRTRLKNYMSALGGMYDLRLASVPWIGLVILAFTAIIADRVYRSSLERQLEEAKGEIRLKADTVAHDLEVLNDLLQERVIQRYRDTVRVAATLEDLLVRLNPAEGREMNSVDARRLAFAVAEARYLCATTAGD